MNPERTTPLRQVRLKRKVTVTELAKGADIDPGHLSRIEKGGSCSAEVAARIVRVLGDRRLSELNVLYPKRYPLKRRRSS